MKVSEKKESYKGENMVLHENQEFIQGLFFDRMVLMTKKATIRR